MKKIHWVILEHVLKRQRAVGTFSRYRMCWWVPFFSFAFYLVGLETGGGHFWLLSLSTLLVSLSPAPVFTWKLTPAGASPKWPLPCHTQQVALASTKGPPKWIPSQGLAPHTRAPQMGFIACCARDPSHIMHLQQSWSSHNGGCTRSPNGHRLSTGSLIRNCAVGPHRTLSHIKLYFFTSGEISNLPNT